LCRQDLELQAMPAIGLLHIPFEHAPRILPVAKANDELHPDHVVFEQKEVLFEGVDGDVVYHVMVGCDHAGHDERNGGSPSPPLLITQQVAGPTHGIGELLCSARSRVGIRRHDVV
jgi:hypothetical protein